MIMTALYTVLEYRHLPASVVIMGSSASYTVTWTVLKLASLPFGERVFFHLEDHLYATYQWMIAFFFEKWSGVEVHVCVCVRACVRAWRCMCVCLCACVRVLDCTLVDCCSLSSMVMIYHGQMRTSYISATTSQAVRGGQQVT